MIRVADPRRGPPCHSTAPYGRVDERGRCESRASAPWDEVLSGKMPGVRIDRGCERNERSDQDLLRAMRRGDPEAFRQFVERYHRLLLHYARRASMREGDEDAFVEELLHDVALALVEPGARAPRSLRAYVVGAFRHKFLAGRRRAARCERAVREAALAASSHGDGGYAVTCSESAIRSSRGPDADDAPVGGASTVLERLATWLDGGLSDEERQLLIAVSESVPQREVAAWLGTTHAAVRKRLERLRARLAGAAVQFEGRLTEDEARELRRFLRRSGGGRGGSRQ